MEYDWTKCYSRWESDADVEQELKEQTHAERGDPEPIMSDFYQAQAHKHDHGDEREFFDRPDAEKIEVCEDYRNRGNYLFSEGSFFRAAQQYQTALSFYEYCFPDDPAEQKRIDELRRACLLNLSLCQIRLGSGHLREAVESARAVLDEAPDCAKAFFRRAQAYRALDEYESASADLGRAMELAPHDKHVIAEMQLLKRVQESYDRRAATAATTMMGLRGADIQRVAPEHTLLRASKHGGLFDARRPWEPAMPDEIRSILNYDAD